MRQDTLRYLTETDWRQLLAQAEVVTYTQGDLILAQGDRRGAIFLLVSGYASIESNGSGQGISLNQIGPGEIFGEISFLEQLGATASVIAMETVRVQILPEEQLAQQLGSDPGLATRFYQSLALTLAHRLRQVIDRVSSLTEASSSALEGVQLGVVDPEYDDAIPDAVLGSLDRFRSHLLQVEDRLKGHHLSGEQAEGRVAEICGTLVREFAQQLQSGHYPARMGDYLFREAFPLLMRSTTIATCHTHGRRYANDYQIGELICNQRAQGEGELGAAIDAWFLDHPLCEARRQGIELLSEQIWKAWKTAALPGVRTTSLACGNSRELFDLFERDLELNIRVTCIDPNAAALTFNVQTYRQLRVIDRMTFLQNDIQAIIYDQEQLALPPQQIIYGLTLCDRWQDEDVVKLLDWIYQSLSEGGIGILSSYQPSDQDRLLLEYVLGWKLIYRSQEDWHRLIQRSLFQQTEVEFMMVPNQRFLLPIIKKI